MKRLGYTRYVSQVAIGEQGISEALAHLAPEGLQGVHTNLLVNCAGRSPSAASVNEPAPASWSDMEKAALEKRKSFGPSGYFIEQARRPQTIGFSLAETPIGLAAWLLDHDSHTYEQLAQAFDGNPEGELTKDEILDNITLYWLTNTGTSACTALLGKCKACLQRPGFRSCCIHCISGELWQAPKSWVENTYKNLIYYHEVDKGGHFAAWEQPQLFAEEVRAAFKST
jgi:hypothetical protein